MYYEEQRGQDKDKAIKRTIQTGMDYGDGNSFNPTSDPTNEYDYYMVLRADWAMAAHWINRTAMYPGDGWEGWRLPQCGQ